MDYFFDTVRVTLGFVFLSAGLLKLAYPGGLRENIARIIRIKFRAIIAISAIVSVVEILLGALLVLGAAYLLLSLAATLALVAFSLYAFGNLGSPAAGCSCFGPLDSNNGSPRAFLARNLFLLSASVAVLMDAGRSVSDPFASNPPSARTLVLAAYLFLFVCVIYIASVRVTQGWASTSS